MTPTPSALAQQWLACFDSKDVDALVALYAVDARHHSPELRVQKPETGGVIAGRAALRDWWAGAFIRLPQLKYVATRITEQDERVVLNICGRRRASPTCRSGSVPHPRRIDTRIVRLSRLIYGPALAIRTPRRIFPMKQAPPRFPASFCDGARGRLVP